MKKHLKKQLLLLFMLTAMLILPAMSALAAGALGDVKNLKQKAVSETSVKLTWSKVKGASGYQVYRVDPASGAATKIASTKKTNHTLKKIVPNTAYTYQVRAFVKRKGATTESVQPATIRVQTSVKKPATPSGLKIASSSETALKLKWNKAKNASGYYVFRYDETEGKYKLLTTTKSTSFNVTNLTEGVAAKFSVQSFRTVSGQVVTGGVAEVSGTPKSLSGLAKQVHGRYFNATLRRNSTGTLSGSGAKKVLKKGTKVTATARSSKVVTVIMKDGTRVKVKGSDLRYNSINATTQEYATNVKEAFVNEKGYSSRTKYLIWISQYTLSVNVFKGQQGSWKLVRRMPCIIGKDGRTSIGTFRLCRKDYAYGGVRVYFTWNEQKQWGNSFHRRVDGHTRGAYSHGCVRLSDADLSYINNTCPMGTTVVSY